MRADAPIAVVGLGLMGLAMAGRLLESGAEVRGFDLNPVALQSFADRGGLVCASPADAIVGCEVALIVVHNEAQVEQVVFGEQGIVSAAASGTVLWLASTVSPVFVRELADRLRARGIELVDGPVSGGVARAETGELSVFVGAAPAAAAVARPVMQACTATLFDAGEVGGGSAIKLINQILTAANIALTAEALSLGERAGVPSGLLIDAIGHSAGASRQFELRAPLMAANDHRVTATIRTFLKDLTIAVDAAEALDASAPVAQAVRSVFEAAGASGMMDESDTMLVEAYRRRFAG